MLKYLWRKYEVITFCCWLGAVFTIFCLFFFWYQQSNSDFLCQANQHCWTKSSAALSSPPLSLKMDSSLIYPDYRFPLSPPSASHLFSLPDPHPFCLSLKEQDEVIIFIISTFLHMELLSWRECQDSYQSMSGVI